MPKHIYLYLFILLSGGVLPQSCRNSPGTNAQLRNGKPASAQVDVLITKGKALQNAAIDSLLPVAQKLHQIYQTTGDKRAEVYAEFYQAHYYWQSADHPKATKIAFQALTSAQKWNIKQPLASIYAVIANLHKENHQFDAAFNYADKGLEAAKANRDTAQIIALLGLKAMFTHSYNFDMKKPDSLSLKLEFEALKIAESNPKYEQLRIRFYDNIAQTYKERGNYAIAINYANKGIALAEKYNQPRSLTYAYNWLGQAYYYSGNKERGLAYLNKALDISKQIKQPYREMELNEAIYECALSSGDYKNALTCLRRYTDLRDSLQVIRNEKQMGEMQVKYETVQKDKQIALLNQSNALKSTQLLWIDIGLAVAACLLIIILIQYFIIRRNSKMIRHSNDMLNEALLKIAFIQSHQVRKPIASILGLVNLIKMDNYTADKETLSKLEVAAEDLDRKIKDVISHTEISAAHIRDAERKKGGSGRNKHNRELPSVNLDPV